MNCKYLVHYSGKPTPGAPCSEHQPWHTTPMHRTGSAECRTYSTYFSLLAATQQPDRAVEYQFTHAAWDKVCNTKDETK
jgi:hypothetical protein